MIIEYEGKKAEAIFDLVNMAIWTDDKFIDEVIWDNAKIQKELLKCYFGNVKAIIIDDLI